MHIDVANVNIFPARHLFGSRISATRDWMDRAGWDGRKIAGSVCSIYTTQFRRQWLLICPVYDERLSQAGRWLHSSLLRTNHSPLDTRSRLNSTRLSTAIDERGKWELLNAGTNMLEQKKHFGTSTGGLAIMEGASLSLLDRKCWTASTLLKRWMYLEYTADRSILADDTLSVIYTIYEHYWSFIFWIPK